MHVVNDLRLLNVKSHTWMTVRSKGQTPRPVANHSSCITGSTIYMFGGWNLRQMSNDINILQISRGSASWSSPKTDNAPSRRMASTMVVFQNQILLFGGKNPEALNDAYTLDRERGRWNKCESRRLPVGKSPGASEPSVLELNGLPSPHCFAHTLVPVNNSLVVYGGSWNEATSMNYVYTLGT